MPYSCDTTIGTLDGPIMETYFDANRYWRITRTVIVLFLLGIMALAPLGTTAQTTGVAPTSDVMVVDSYDCETGRLEFRYIPESDGPLGYAIYADYEEGPRFTGLPAGQFNPQPQIAPYTGDVSLGATLSPSLEFSGSDEPSGAIAPIDIDAGVSSERVEITLPVDCDDDGSLADGLVAALKRILQDILA